MGCQNGDTLHDTHAVACDLARVRGHAGGTSGWLAVACAGLGYARRGAVLLLVAARNGAYYVVVREPLPPSPCGCGHSSPAPRNGARPKRVERRSMGRRSNAAHRSSNGPYSDT